MKLSEYKQLMKYKKDLKELEQKELQKEIQRKKRYWKAAKEEKRQRRIERLAMKRLRKQ